jgi:dTDP-4-dehydrorhamnose reductase
MRLLITGASGYLGSQLVWRSIADGWDVAAWSREREPPGGEVWRFDIRDPESVERALLEWRPEVVIHTAYVQNGSDAWSTNVYGSFNVATACATAGARLIQLSTDHVFDGRRGNYSEADEPRPVIPYGVSKLAAERAVQRAHTETLIVRSALLYGGMPSSQHEQRALGAARGDVQARFFVDEIQSPISIEDAAAALLELATSALEGILHLGGPEPLTRLDLARAVVAARAGDPERLRSSTIADSGLLRPRDCSLDSSRARALLQTRLRSVREVLGEPVGTAQAG